ncbi:MAG: hypothetical protein N2C14_13005, partial [Planctomycetales bacterium]
SAVEALQDVDRLRSRLVAGQGETVAAEIAFADLNALRSRMTGTSHQTLAALGGLQQLHEELDALQDQSRQALRVVKTVSLPRTIQDGDVEQLIEVLQGFKTPSDQAANEEPANNQDVDAAIEALKQLRPKTISKTSSEGDRASAQPLRVEAVAAREVSDRVAEDASLEESHDSNGFAEESLPPPPSFDERHVHDVEIDGSLTDACEELFSIENSADLGVGRSVEPPKSRELFKNDSMFGRTLNALLPTLPSRAPEAPLGQDLGSELP